MNTVNVLLPAYNEENAIVSVISDCIQIKSSLIYKYNMNLLITVIDDGSTDNTVQRVLQTGNKDMIKIIEHKTNRGLGEAIKTGINNFVNEFNEEDYLIIMDADSTHKPMYILDLIEKQMLTKADVVIASRFTRDSKIYGLNFSRKKLSDYAKTYYTKFLNIPNVKDYTCGYRLYKYSILRELVNKYDKNIILEKGFTGMVEVLYKIKLVGGKFEEIPFDLRYDQKLSESKMKVCRNTYKSLLLPFKRKMKWKAM